MPSLSDAFICSFIALLALRGFFYARALLSGAPYIASTARARRNMIELAELRPAMTVYDLGSGAGDLLLMAAERGARAVGIEIDPFPVLSSRLRARYSGSAELIEVRWGDFWKRPFGDADVVFVYLVPYRMAALKGRLQRQLKPGTVVISNRFLIEGWTAYKASADGEVRAYRVPAGGERP